MTSPVQPDQLRISIEMGDQYQPSERLGAALGELASALGSADADADVEGFALGSMEPRLAILDETGLQEFKALSYDSLSPVSRQGNAFTGLADLHGELQ